MVNQQFAFAVHALSLLAREYNCDNHNVRRDNSNRAERSAVSMPMTSDFLASSINTNPVVIRRLLSKLSKSGLIETQLGKKGGVKLKKNPKQITLRDIFESVQSKSLISENKNKENKKCVISCKMKVLMSGIIDKAEEATLKYFESVTLAEITAQI